MLGKWKAGKIGFDNRESPYTKIKLDHSRIDISLLHRTLLCICIFKIWHKFYLKANFYHSYAEFKDILLCLVFVY